LPRGASVRNLFTVVAAGISWGIELNRLFRIALLLTLALLAGCSRPQFQDARGGTVDWHSLRGQWVVVNYWALWCEPCHKEVPALNNLDQRPDVTVLGVNFDGKTGKALRGAIRKMGISYRVLTVNPAKQFGWETPIVLPASLLVNPEGKLVEARFGVQTEKGVMARIRKSEDGTGS